MQIKYTNHHIIMGELQNKLSGICNLIPKNKPVLYLGYPIHLNVGDSLIALGTEKFFKDYGYNIIHRSGIQDFPSNFKVPEDVTLVLQGGGNFGDLYYNYDQKWRENIVRLYPNNRIVLLPQSLDYNKGSKNLDMAIQVFNTHQNMHICLRDINSKIEADKYFKNTYLFPDMAQQLWGELPIDIPPAKGSLYFIRNDFESTIIPKELYNNGINTCDWDCLFSRMDITITNIIRRTKRIEGIAGIEIISYKPWYKFRDHFIKRSINFFGQYNDIVTNRLHAAILGCLLEKKVKAFDNTNKKISAYHQTWFKESDYFSIIDG